MKASIRKKHEYWEGELKQWRISGKSVSGYCRSNNISVWKFYYWKKRLNGSCNGKFVKLSISEGMVSSTGLWIELSGGIRLIIERGFDSEELSRVLAAAGGGKC